MYYLRFHTFTQCIVIISTYHYPHPPKSPMSGPKETPFHKIPKVKKDEWLSMVPRSISKAMLASSFSITSTSYTFQRPCQHLSSSHLLCSPNLPPTHRLPSPKPLILLITLLFWLFFFSLPLLLLSPLSVPTHPPSALFLLLSWPGPVCWPCPVYYFFSLLWTLPGASGYFVSLIHKKKEQSCPQFLYCAPSSNTVKTSKCVSNNHLKVFLISPNKSQYKRQHCMLITKLIPKTSS